MSKPRILWFVDRFGIPGAYKRIFIRLLGNAGLSPLDVVTSNLHTVLSGTLLEKYKNRKAATWVPNREKEIVGAMMQLAAIHQPKIIVISAPEALCILSLKPEVATLMNTRGGVYQVTHKVTGEDGKRRVTWEGKIMVTLPISAWHTHMRSVSMAGGREVDMIMAMGGDADSQDIEVIEDIDDSLETPDPEDSDDPDDVDNFKHEPMVVPVGRVMLRFDYMKLGRLVNDLQVPSFEPDSHNKFYLGEWKL